MNLKADSEHDIVSKPERNEENRIAVTVHKSVSEV